MEYIPGGHKLDQIPHRDTFAKHYRGTEIASYNEPKALAQRG